MRVRHSGVIVEAMYIHCCFKVVGNASLRRDAAH